MEVEVGNIVLNPGTASQDSERLNSTMMEVISVEPMDIDNPMFPVRPVPGWAQPIMAYILDGTLPENEVEARQILRRSKAYTVINQELYKRSVTEVL